MILRGDGLESVLRCLHLQAYHRQQVLHRWGRRTEAIAQLCLHRLYLFWTMQACQALIEFHFQRAVSNVLVGQVGIQGEIKDRKSTRLNSSHVSISYAVFCLKKKKIERRFFLSSYLAGL